MERIPEEGQAKCSRWKRKGQVRNEGSKTEPCTKWGRWIIWILVYWTTVESHPCGIIIRAMRGGMLLTPVLFLTPGASSSSLLAALCQPVLTSWCVCVWRNACGRWGWGGERGNRSVSWNVNEISLYLLFPLAAALHPKKQRRQSFLGCKAVVGKAWLDTLILLSFGRAWKKTPDNKNRKGMNGHAGRKCISQLLQRPFQRRPNRRPPRRLTPTTHGRKLAGVCRHRNRRGRTGATQGSDGREGRWI